MARLESEVVPTGPGNPYGLSLRQKNSPLRTEAEGKQDFNWATQCAWKVVNDDVHNGLGTPPAYKLVPDSPVFARCKAIGHTVWVTPNSSEERWPAGEFATQSKVDNGPPELTPAPRTGRSCGSTP